MNILTRKLSQLRGDDTTPFDELSEEEQAKILADEKKDRIEEHRSKVRNGPVRWTSITSGQMRRRRVRDAAAHSKKATRRARKSYHAAQAETATLRGQLIILKVLPSSSDFVPTMTQRLNASTWIVRKFGLRNDEGELILHDDVLAEAAQAALNEYARRTTKQPA